MGKLSTTQVEQEVLWCQTNALNAAKDSVQLGICSTTSKACMGQKKSATFVTRCTIQLNRHVGEAHMGDTRECLKQG